MIAISESLIRSFRSFSFDDEKQQPTMVEQLLSSSPTHMPKTDGKTRLESASIAPEPAAAPRPEPIQPQRTEVIKFGQENEKAAAAVATATGKHDTQPPPPKEAPPHPPKDKDEKKEDSKSPSLSPLFVKEAIKPSPVLSSLSRELADNGVLSRPARSEKTTDLRNPHHQQTPSEQLDGSSTDRKEGPHLALKVFVSIGEPPLKIEVKGFMKVDQIVDMILHEYTAQNRQPPLPTKNNDLYELRMLDDEDDGTPDNDMPPLDRYRDIHKFGVDAVALIFKSATGPGSGSSGMGSGNDGPSRKVSLKVSSKTPIAISGDKFFLKVHMPNHESHVVPVTKSMVLEDLLPILSKKKKIKMLPPNQYKFLYMEEPDESSGTLEMKTGLGELKADEVRLVNKFAGNELNQPQFVLLPSSGDPDPSQFVFTTETACAYSEYKVVKTNERGRKQKRIMGVDKSTIYNKKNHEESIFNVHKDQRSIGTVSSCSVIKNKPRTFQIAYREKNGIISREYEAETKMECAEIVAKINFLMTLSHSESAPK